MRLNYSIRWISMLLLIIVGLPLSAAIAQSNDTPSSLNGQIPSGLGSSLFFFDLDSSTSSIIYMTLETERDGAFQSAEVKLSVFTEIVESETSLHEWVRQYTKVEFLSPADLAGDVFLFETFRGNETLFFWNPDLVSALRVDDTFQIFGELTIFTLIGDQMRFYDVDRDFDARYVDADIPQPESLDEKLFIGRWVRIIENQLLVTSENQERVPFPRLRLLTYNYVLPYQIDFMDEDFNVIREMHYPDWRDHQEIIRPDGQTDFYMKEVLLVNRVIPGNTTRLLIDRIEYEQVTLNQYEPDKLGD